MNIALPILLLIFGGLSFWLLTESSLKWYIKAVCISTFCLFTILFWITIHSFLGWPADESDAPETVRVHWVIIKEPNKRIGYVGAIYVLIQSTHKETDPIRKFFGYKASNNEPRLFGLPYSRQLHENMMQNIVPKLRRGQPVVGKLTRDGPSKSKGDDESKSKGGGSESQDQDWHFHELLPSEIHRKPER